MHTASRPQPSPLRPSAARRRGLAAALSTHRAYGRAGVRVQMGGANKVPDWPYAVHMLGFLINNDL